MKNIFHNLKKHSTHLAKHVRKHKHRYALGTFGTFAVVKMFVLLVGAVGVFQLGNTFAAGGGLNSGNIVTTYGCPTDSTECNLSNKNITSIATDTFINHTGLQTLYLYTNQIASIESGDFAGLDSLIELRLNNNKITSLESGDFAGLGNLDYLYLFSNKIASIENGVLGSLSGLKYLGLDDNLLTTLPEDMAGLTILSIGALNLSTNCRNTGSMSTGLVGFLDTKVGNTTWQTSESLSCPVTIFSCANITDVSEAECEALSGLYYSTSGSGWSNQTNWLSGTTVEDWYGITVKNGQVSIITIVGNLTGELPSLSVLTGLTEVYLGSNFLTGIIPGAFSGLTKLVTLRLNDNQLSTIDLAGLGNLETLYLDNNSFSKSIDFSGLNNLLYLSLQNLQIETFDFTPLSKLATLTIRYNGSVKTLNLSGLTNLGKLYIMDNGKLSSISLGSLPNLTDANLYNNDLTGIDVSGISNVTNLLLQNNQLTTIDISSNTNLIGLNLQSNQLTGISDDLITLTNLVPSKLNIYNNLINYYLLSTSLLDFIDLKHATNEGEWRTTQTFTIESNDYLCGNTTCESSGYCALMQTGNISCSSYAVPTCASNNGCFVETGARSCGGSFDCGKVLDETSCNQYSCQWNVKPGTGSYCGKQSTPPAACSTYSAQSCPTAFGCLTLTNSTCTGTFDEMTITQEQCGTTYSGTWLTEDINSCPVDCTKQSSEGELSTTINGTGYFSGLVFSQSANVTGVVSGDIINYTFGYENTAMDTYQFGVYIKEYLPRGLTLLSSSGALLSGYVDHEVVYGNTGDICFQQFLDSTGAYYRLFDDAFLGTFGTSAYYAAQDPKIFGYTGTEAEVGQYFYDNMCLSKGYTNLQDCFNTMGLPNPLYSYPQLMPVGSGCGIIGEELQQPYYYRYVGTVITGQNGKIIFSAQYDGSGTGGTVLTNHAEYYTTKIATIDGDTDVLTGIAITLNTLITPTYDLEIIKTLLTDGPYIAGMQVEYQIDYTNRGNLPLSFTVEERPDEYLSLVSNSDIDYTKIVPDKVYGVEGDVCYDNYLNETGVYMDALDERAAGMSGMDEGAFTGTTTYDFFRYFYSASYNESSLVWDEQENTLAEFTVALLEEMMSGSTFQEAISATMKVDITTLDESCGLQSSGLSYYTVKKFDFAPGATYSGTVIMQIDNDVQGRQTVENNAHVLYNDGSGDVEKISTASMVISSSKFSAKAGNNGYATITVFGGTKTSVDDKVWNEIVNVTYATTYVGLGANTAVQGVVDLDFGGDAIFDKPIQITIPVSNVGSYLVKADHGKGATLDGLTLDPDSTCSYGISSVPYNGSAITADGKNIVIIYSCSASSFVAYTTTTSASTPSGGGGGGTIAKDICPVSRDCSDSYYDKLCGKCSLVEKIIEKIPFHGAADLPIGSIINSSFSNELNNAYLRAYSNNITTMPTIQRANIEGVLIRKDMAKMITNFAINVLGKDISTGSTCEFSDMMSLTKEEQYYAIAACRLGLMGLESDGVTIKNTFNPDLEVDRAQFGTILSRLLRKDKNNGGTNYYENHLNALQKEGIMTKIDTPFAKEMRGRVMLMMQRIFEKE